jgi:hypothetical protein
MALLGNYTLASKSPGRSFAGNSTAHASGLGQFTPQAPSMWSNAGPRRNFALQNMATTARVLTSRPEGYAGAGYMLPITGGGISSHNAANGVTAWSGAIVAGRNIAGTFDGAAAFTGTGALVVSGVGAFAGVGAFTGNVTAALNGTATFDGIAAFAGTLLAKGNMLGTFAGEASFGAIEYAVGSMSGSFAPAITLEAQGFSQYLLDQEDIETGLTFREALKLIAAATAGTLSGGGSSTVTIKSAVDDTKDRIVATVDSQGNRTAIVYDLT